MLDLVLSENRKNSFPKKKHLSVLIAKISSRETQKITNSVPHGSNNNKNIKICAHTEQHGILGLGTSRSPRMSAPFLPHSRFVLNYYQRKQESLFLSTNNFFNFEYSGFNMGSGPTSPQEPLYHSEDEESLCPPGASVQKREQLSALYYFKTSHAPRLYKNS